MSNYDVNEKGYYGEFGGAWIPEMMAANVGELKEKYLDISHIQVILLGNALVENGRWQEFLSWLKQEPFMGENVYLFSTEDPEAVLALDGEGSSMGEFLTGLLENRLPGQQKEGVTLRQVYHLWYQEGALMHLPVIKAENDSIQVFFPGENKDG